MIVGWDSAYNATPTSSLSRSLIDDEIRQTIFGIRERMAAEHRWGPLAGASTDPADLSYQLNALAQGRHIPGGTTICGLGDETARDAIVTPQIGSLYIVQDGSNFEINLYKSTGWATISTLDHSELTGRTDDDHPQYVLKDGGAMTGNLNMGGGIIATSATGDTSGQFTLYRHREASHGNIENIDAITDNAVTLAKLSIQQSSVSVTLTRPAVGDNPTYYFELPLLSFFPQIYVIANYNSDFPQLNTIGYNGSGTGYGWTINTQMTNGASRSFRIRKEWIA
jgi:hypothetical protein